MPSAGNDSTEARVAPVPALIVGAGPAGLAAAACLKQRGIDALVLDAGTAVGASWRQRYDRLHLHTVKQHSFLPGMRFAKDFPAIRRPRRWSRTSNRTRPVRDPTAVR